MRCLLSYRIRNDASIEFCTTLKIMIWRRKTRAFLRARSFDPITATWKNSSKTGSDRTVTGSAAWTASTKSTATLPDQKASRPLPISAARENRRRDASATKATANRTARSRCATLCCVVSEGEGEYYRPSQKHSGQRACGATAGIGRFRCGRRLLQRWVRCC